MSTNDEIAIRTQRFVDNLRHLVLQAAREAVQGVLSQSAPAPAIRPAPAKAAPAPAKAAPAKAAPAKPAPAKPAPAKPAPAKPAPAKPAPGKPKPAPAKAAPAKPAPAKPAPAKPAPAKAKAAPAKPAAPAPQAAAAEPSPGDSKREARVLEAVGSLGNARAGEIAKHAHLPNGSTAVALRALVGRGQLVRTETPRGAEYGLPSKG
jgi:outer membrane biosynthesis protein TonB